MKKRVLFLSAHLRGTHVNKKYLQTKKFPILSHSDKNPGVIHKSMNISWFVLHFYYNMHNHCTNILRYQHSGYAYFNKSASQNHLFKSHPQQKKPHKIVNQNVASEGVAWVGTSIEEKMHQKGVKQKMQHLKVQHGWGLKSE